MAIFRRGRELDVPDPHTHERALSERADAAAARVAELRAVVEQLAGEHEEAAIEGRFDDHEAAGVRLDATRAELARAEAAHEVLRQAAGAVASERQRLDHEARLAELEQETRVAVDEAARAAAEVPALLRAAQQQYAAAEAAEGRANQTAAAAHELRVALGLAVRGSKAPKVSYAGTSLSALHPVMLSVRNLSGL